MLNSSSAANTSQLGDVNTLFVTSLQSAVMFKNPHVVQVTLCTPQGVAKHHPIAARFPLLTTPICEIQTKNLQLLVIDVTRVNPISLRIH